MFLSRISAILLLAMSLTALAQDAESVIFRCGTPSRMERLQMFGESDPLLGNDCSDSQTNPTSAYDPTTIYEIPVVIHIIMNDNGSQGAITDDLVFSQIEILNEDFQALAGTPGEPGVYAGIRFVLADTDPNGDPHSGITRSNNTTWFNDGGSYWNSLNWDPNRYVNIYTNTAGGNLGYVPFLPANGNGSAVGTPADRVVILWDTFGRDAPFFPFDQGRTATHEVGHYLGLEHTFSGGCSSATAPGCYTGGDLICDTQPESGPNFGDCSGGDPGTCGNPDPIHNYMDYSDDRCMNQFTTEQMRRMRCTLETWRTNLYTVDNGSCDNSDLALEAGDNPSICAGGSVTMDATPSGGAGGYSYSWEPTTGLSSPDVADPVASPTQTTVYTVTVTDNNGCEATDTVTVEVIPNDTAQSYPSWQDPNNYQGTYDLDDNGIINILDILALVNFCAP